MSRSFSTVEILGPLSLSPVIPPEEPPLPPSPIAAGSWVDASRDGSTIAVGESTPDFTGGEIHMCRGVDFLTVTTLISTLGAVNEYGNGIATNADGSIVVCGCLHDDVVVDGFAAVRYGTDWEDEIWLEPAGANAFLCYGGGIPVAISDDGSIIVLINKGGNSVYVCSGVNWGTVVELSLSAGSDAWCVAISGDGTVIAVGNGGDKVHVFSGASYVTETIVTPASLDSFPSFGASVALNSDGTVLAVGNPSDGSGQRGAAYIFTGASWATEQKFFVASGPYESPSEYYGWSVDISADASVAAFSAYNRLATGSGNPFCTGIVFRESGSGYSVETEVYEPNAASFASFGLGVALSEDGAVMGVVSSSGIWAIT